MGLFSFIGKAAKGLLKVGAKLLPGPVGLVAKGASDIIGKIDKAKATAQDQALIAKAGLHVPPRAQVTRTPGWAFGDTLGKGGRAYKPPARARRPTRADYEAQGYDQYEFDADMARARKPRKAKKAPRKPAKASSGAKRAPPKGGLDLKALSASWKAAGKPGTWQGWIQANK